MVTDPSAAASKTFHVWLTCGCGGNYDLPADTEFPTVLRCHYHREDQTTVAWEAVDVEQAPATPSEMGWVR